MLVGEEKEIRRDDGSVFVTRQVRSPKSGTHLNVIVLNEHIMNKACALLPFARSMSTSKKARLNFLRSASECLMIDNGAAYSFAENEFRRATARLAKLELLSAGSSMSDSQVVTLEDWVMLLDFFHQDLSIGAIRTIGG